VKKQRHAVNRVLLPILLLAAVGLSACRGGVRVTAWTGLAVDDGTVYVADLEYVRALDATSGRELWHFPDDADGPFYTVTLLPDEALFVTYQKRTGGLFAQSTWVLQALDLDGRDNLWPNEITDAGGEYVASGAIGDGLLVIGNSDGHVYAHHLDDGSLAWTFPVEDRIGRVWATPLIISDTVYVASLDHNLYALDLRTGRQRWVFHAGGAMVGQPLALDGRLYVGSFDHRVYAVRQDDGTPVPQFELEGANWFWGTPATDGTTIYAADVDGNVYAVDAENGAPKWPAPVRVGEPVHLGPLLSEDGNVLLVAGTAGTLYGLDADNGDLLWSESARGQPASMAVSGEFVYLSRIYGDAHVQAFLLSADGSQCDQVWTFPPPESEE